METLSDGVGVTATGGAAVIGFTSAGSAEDFPMGRLRGIAGGGWGIGNIF